MENAKRWAKFLREKPPYNLFEIETEDFRFLASEFTIKMEAFCDKCGKERIFKCYNKDGIKSIKGELLENTPQPTQTSREPYKSKEHFIDLEFVCDYCEDIHRISIKVTIENAMKYGQYPSYARERVYEVVKYKNIISKYYTELTRAINLYSQKYGIAAFVHLRRIFEHLIDIKCKKYNVTTEGKRFQEKLKLVEDNEQVIPIEFETEKNMIYSVLSKGVHEYEEEECYELYPTLEYIIMSILDIELEKKNRNKKIKEIKKQIATKRTEDKGVESIVDENE